MDKRNREYIDTKLRELEGGLANDIRSIQDIRKLIGEEPNTLIEAVGYELTSIMHNRNTHYSTTLKTLFDRLLISR